MSERILDWEFPAPWPYEGVVIGRDDPEELGRVRVEIPGEVDDTGWLLPFGNPAAGGKQRGALIVPPLNADVLVFYPGGDRENGRYIASNYGKPFDAETFDYVSEVPEGTDVAGDDDGDNIVWLDERLKIEVDSRPVSAGVRITDKSTGTAIKLDLDASGRTVTITGELGVTLSTSGTVRIVGGSVFINGRPVSPVGPPI